MSTSTSTAAPAYGDPDAYREDGYRAPRAARPRPAPANGRAAPVRDPAPAPRRGRESRRAGVGAASRAPAGESTPRPSGSRRPASARRPTAPAPRRVPPTGRLGVLWGLVLVGATVAAPAVVAVVVAPVAAVAAASLVRHGPQVERRAALVAAVGAALVPLAATAGWPVAVAVALGAAAAVRAAGGGSVPAAAGALWPGLGAATLVLADHGSLGTRVSLVSAICLFDVANYLMGTGSSGGVLGAVAGVVTVGVLAVMVAAVVNPPFSGDRPWVMFGLVALLAPLGVVVARRLAADARLPALRRLDSLLLAGPAWVVASHLLLR
ncbi:hypothetical protein K6U06_02125 [Acidiferrimicrobium sp. IK]|uniref:hypothetical protein n=1 Tax=Acidiferrimicrobium sp. IK TaxID=2871700 RepID=UPI0021CB7D3E|nr:hypothetical protein [Acidiferrimicrobium sp. IK]MCU4183141.1 hypothetical protein [Acidiferrimicrobium sp. IK]